MKHCKECGKPVSTNAKCCPHCGSRRWRGSSFSKALGVIVVGFLGLVIIGVLGGESTTPSTANANQSPVAVPQSVSPAPSQRPRSAHVDNTELPSKPKIELAAKAIDNHRVEFIIKTNIPLPIEVMAGVSLEGQASDDVFIGHDERIKIIASPIVFILDTSKARKSLPTGNYIAEVTFYPNWGAVDGNTVAGSIGEEVEDTAKIRLGGSGEYAEHVAARNRSAKWIMETVFIGMEWDPKEFQRGAGKFKTLPFSEYNYHTAYYFPKADITVLVNTLKNTVTTWRNGRITN